MRIIFETHNYHFIVVPAFSFTNHQPAVIELVGSFAQLHGI